MTIDQLLLAAASSKLAGGKLRYYFIITWGCFLSVRLYLTEIRPNAGTTTEKAVCCSFSKKWLNRKEDSVKQIALQMNRHVCLVFSSFKITFFSI